MSFYDYKNDAPDILRADVISKIIEMDKKDFIRANDNYVIIKVAEEVNKDDKSILPKIDFYVVSDPLLDNERKKDFLGQGSFGKIVKGWKLAREKTKGEAASDFIPVAVKVVNDEKISLEKMKLEEEINRLFYPLETEPIIHVPNMHKIFLITKRLPEEPLIYRQRVAPAVSQSELVKKLDLIVNILNQVNMLHSFGFLHGDLTADNVLVDVYSDPMKPYLTDFGNVRSRSGAVLTSPGTPGHIAPELLHAKFEEATDIYSIAPDFMAILGATHPYRDKLAARKSSTDVDEQNIAEVKTPFNTSGLENMLNGVDMDRKGKAFFQKTITEFLNSMVNPNPKLRPSVDEAIQFFNIMHNVLERFMENKVPSIKQPSPFKFFSKGKNDKEMLVSLIKDEEKKMDVSVKHIRKR